MLSLSKHTGRRLWHIPLSPSVPTMQTKSFALLAIFAATLAGCAPQPSHLTSAPRPDWAFEKSDLPVDPAFRFGKLDNGMRYVIRANARPKATGLVRLEVEAGSLDESEAERGYAHYVEHMAFNGSAQIPEGEMVRLLERNGLAFGADTNASTSFERTVYSLDLPTNDPKLLGTALMLMRETASELTFAPDAVARERGVVLSEMRDRKGYALRNFEDLLAFTYPGARYGERLPIGAPATLDAATSDTLKAFWQREYVPAHATLVVIGDFDPATVESAIRARFGDWRPAPAPGQPSPGPVRTALKGKTDVFLDPALAERVTVSRNGQWLGETDTRAQRRENLLRQLGYAIVNRRLSRRSLVADPPFRAAALGTSDVFKAGRTTNLVVDTADGKWPRGLTVAANEYRRALRFGFTKAEVDEQIAEVRTAHRNAALGAATRSNAALYGAVSALLHNDIVPDTPQNSFARLEQFLPQITPTTVLAALKRELVPLNDPLIRFQGRRPVVGGAAALRSAWNKAIGAPVTQDAATTAAVFAYTDFGPPGQVVADMRDRALGIREVRFANGVRLNLKQTDHEQDRIALRLSVDGGQMLDTKANPLATKMTAVLGLAGLGKHSFDELETVTAGRTVSAQFSDADEAFVAGATTTPADLELELQLLAAYLTDPGYRPEAETLYRQTINNFFASLRATPQGALNADLGTILSAGDPRFSLAGVEDFRKLTLAKFKADIGDRLAHGAVELGMAGDIDEDAAIALVAKTLGAIPQRESDFQRYPEQRARDFAADRKPRVLRHSGPADQALLRVTWPTTGGDDPVAALQQQLLQRVVQIELTATLREKLGKAYSPGVGGEASRTYPGYGTFWASATIDVNDVPAARAAIAEAVAEVRDRPVGDDVLLRARAPLIEALDNTLKSNGGWLAYVANAQSKPDRIDRYLKARARLQAITAAQLQMLARHYLGTGSGLEVLVLPEGAATP